MKWSYQQKFILACALIAFSIQIGIGYFFHWQERQMHAVKAEREHTAKVDALFDELLSNLKDAETGQRGYLLTGNPRYLPPYWHALRHIEEEFTQLRQLIAASHSGWPPRLARVQALSDAKLAELKQTIRLQQNGRNIEALGVVRTHRGQALMQEIRKKIAEIKTDEQRKLSADDQYLTGLDKQIHWTAGITGVFSMLLFGISLLLLSRQVKLRGLSEQALRVAKEMAHSSQVRLERALGAAGLGVSEQDPQSGMTWDWNLSGPMSPHDQNPPRAFHELLARLHPADRRQLLEDQQKALAGSGMVRTEYWLPGKDGQPYWLATRTSTVKESADSPQLLVSVTKNITEQKLAEQKLQETQQMLQLILDNVPQRIFWKDTHLNYLGCNLSFARDAALAAPEDIVGQNDFNMPWQQEAVLYRADDQATMTEGRPKIHYEELQTYPDGSQRWLHTSKVPLHDHSGQIIGLLGTYEDITARRLVDEKLRQSEERLRVITDNVPALIGYFDRHEHYAFANATYVKWFNRAQGELPGLTVREVIGETPYTEAAPYIRQALGGEQVTYGFRMQVAGAERAI